MSRSSHRMDLKEYQFATGSSAFSRAFARAVEALRRDEPTLLYGRHPGDLNDHLIGAIISADRCSACNRFSRTMRDKGNGVLWCGRTKCLEAIRELQKPPEVPRAPVEVHVVRSSMPRYKTASGACSLCGHPGGHVYDDESTADHQAVFKATGTLPFISEISLPCDQCPDGRCRPRQAGLITPEATGAGG